MRPIPTCLMLLTCAAPSLAYLMASQPPRPLLMRGEGSVATVRSTALCPAKLSSYRSDSPATVPARLAARHIARGGSARGPVAVAVWSTSSSAYARVARVRGPLASSSGGGGGDERAPIVRIVDDVLDYLTNMGGYTGFTEEELKGSAGEAGGRITERKMESFGKAKEGIDETTTTVFVTLLILFPSALLFLGIFLYGPPAIFTFATN